MTSIVEVGMRDVIDSSMCGSLAGDKISDGDHLENNEGTLVKVSSPMQADCETPSIAHSKPADVTVMCSRSMEEHSYAKACNMDKKMESDSSSADSDETKEYSTFSEAPLQAAQSLVPNITSIERPPIETLTIEDPKFEDDKQNVWFSCYMCRFYFPNSRTLEDHNKMNHNHELPHICRVCAKRFRSMYSLIQHCEELHKNSKIPCKPCICLLCKQRYERSGDGLRSHMICHFRDINVHTCSICHKTERTKWEMITHMSSHLQFRFQCPVCVYKTNYRRCFSSHWGGHKRKLRRVRKICEICGKSTYCLAKHKKIHLPTKDFRCGICGACFRTKHDLTSHLRRHTDKNFATCEICGKITTNLIKHRTYYHLPKKQFWCEECGARLKTKEGLKQHMLVHKGEKLTCEICGKGIRHLAKHMRTHTDERPYKCDICNKGFRQMCTLQNHIRTHTSDRPFSCSVCKKKFTQQQAVARHMRVHTGEKPYECLVCQMRFTQSSGLNGHMTRHQKGTFANA